MLKNLTVILVTVAIMGLAQGTLTPAAAQNPGNVGWKADMWAGTGKVPPPTAELASKGDVNGVVFKWMWYMGMLRGFQERDSSASFELRKATGTIRVQNQACKLTNYRASINYQLGGMRAHYTCTLPNGQKHENVEVLSGEFAWDEDIPGAELVAGKGKATPNAASRPDRLIRLWAGPWGAPKSAIMGKGESKVAMEGDKPVVTFPIPNVAGGVAKATLNAENQAERIEVKNGNSVTEFTYQNYGDWNPEDDQIQGYTPKRITEKKDGVTVLDITVMETHVGNLYVVMPVPESIKNAAGR